ESNRVRHGLRPPTAPETALAACPEAGPHPLFPSKFRTRRCRTALSSSHLPLCLDPAPESNRELSATRGVTGAPPPRRCREGGGRRRSGGRAALERLLRRRNPPPAAPRATFRRRRRDGASLSVRTLGVGHPGRRWVRTRPVRGRALCSLERAEKRSGVPPSGA